MSLQAWRECDEAHRRGRALVEMRDTVAAAIVAQHPDAGEAAVDAVGEAILQLVTDGGYLAEPAEVKNRLFVRANRRMIDHGRCAENRYRDPVAIDENAQALRLSVFDDLTELTDEARREWRVREILSVLSGKESLWAEAWLIELNAGRNGRGLDDMLGWKHNTTKGVSRRARHKMAAFIEQRDNGVVCSERQALLDAFVLATANRPGPELGHDDLKSVLFHIAGCEDCWTAWHVRRRSLVGRFAAVATLPIGHAAAAAAALRAKLAAVVSGAHGAAFSARHRLGLGGGAGAAVTGGGVATISGKAAAICGAVVCAASAAGGAVVEAVPGLLPPITHHPAHRASHQRSPRPATVRPTARLASYAPTTTVRDQTTTTPPAATTTTQPAPTRDQSYTPGDLPTAASQQSSPSPSAQTSATSTSSGTTASRPGAAPRSEHAQPTCTPGDLAC